METLELQWEILNTLKKIMEVLDAIQKENAERKEPAQLPPWGEDTQEEPGWEAHARRMEALTKLWLARDR